ncbi:MarR family winged helix-turn-helix transcriptional regulator [Ramlibacter rhizophilus]|uniref:MarR family transcriptional regulator n=1 Tax=Ramlibacter rhizophilus TaxID=1781167 RepID=A0A4Z0BRN3_9BURK|nr:MarR family transcriptional regulator [Ramlibacter rhizophilus]TFZ01481.1 MarR family transcriptional regulator [Ramlibacter rhizophilus]
MPARPSRLRQPERLDDLLLYRLGRLTATAGTMVIRLCEGRHGITRREWRVIAALWEAEALLSSELAERIQLDRARTSRAITSMVAKQLLQRTAGAADRRQARLSLTEAGRSLYRKLMPEVQAINRDILAVLSADQVRTLDEALARMQLRAAQLAAEAELPKADRRRGGRSRALLG